jgi:hypothetical protein
VDACHYNALGSVACDHMRCLHAQPCVAHLQAVPGHAWLLMPCAHCPTACLPRSCYIVSAGVVEKVCVGLSVCSRTLPVLGRICLASRALQHGVAHAHAHHTGGGLTPAMRTHIPPAGP